MKAILLSTVAAIGLALGFAPQQASAHWDCRPVTRWDPVCARYVTVSERYWVPDCAPPPCGPVVVAPRVHVEHRRHEHERYHHVRGCR
jgi:hypothetical protein